MSQDKEKRKRRAPLHPGDVVRVLEPTFVWRVGYPKRLEDYLRPLRNDPPPALDKLLESHGRAPALDSLLGRRGRCAPTYAYDRVRERVLRELAYLEGMAEGWGGPDRQLHEVERPEQLGAVMVVDKVVTRVTGRRYPGSSPSGLYEDDGEPPGLDSPSVHRLALVSVAHEAVGGGWYGGCHLLHCPSGRRPDLTQLLRCKGDDMHPLYVDVRRLELVKKAGRLDG